MLTVDDLYNFKAARGDSGSSSISPKYFLSACDAGDTLPLHPREVEGRRIDTKEVWTWMPMKPGNGLHWSWSWS